MYFFDPASKDPQIMAVLGVVMVLCYLVALVTGFQLTQFLIRKSKAKIAIVITALALVVLGVFCLLTLKRLLWVGDYQTWSNGLEPFSSSTASPWSTASWPYSASAPSLPCSENSRAKTSLRWYKMSEPLKKHHGLDDMVNQVIEGDCLEIMRDIPPKLIDMILSDLPYGLTQNHWDSIIPLDKLWKQYERIIKDKGVIALTAQGIFAANLIISNPKLFKYKIIWIKSKPTNFLNAKKQPLRKHEDILIFYKKQPVYHPQMNKGEPYNKGFRKDQFTGSYGDFKTVEVKSNGERYPTDVVYFKTAESDGEVYHPTQKPIELGRYLIRTYTNPGQLVLDNACGSGSFLVSAVLEGRNFIGIEKNKDVYLFKKKPANYIEICWKRIEKGRELFDFESRKLSLF